MPLVLCFCYTWAHVTKCRWGSLPFGVDLLRTALGDPPARDRACSVAADETALRTPAWYFRRSAAEVDLYVKPDDRWEMNNVVQRCPQVADAMQQALDHFEEAAKSGRLNDLRPLERLLTEAPS